MDTSDWRTQLRPSTRKRSFNKIMNTLKTYHYFGDEDGLLELQKIAQSFEEKTYAGATSKFDYSRKIAFKLRLMESKFQNTTFKPHLMETSLDSTAQTGQPNGGDWQEEVYQKITTMKENYLPELNEMYQKIATKLQQHDSLPQQPKSDQLEKLKVFKMMLERIITFLQVSKSSILPNFKEKLGSYEKQIINFINTNRPRKAMSSLQPGHLAPPHMHSMSQPQSQVTQVQSHENPMNSQLQTTNIQGPVATMQQNNMASMQHSSMSGVSTAPQMETGTNVNNIPSNQVGPSNKPPDPEEASDWRVQLQPDSRQRIGKPNHVGQPFTEEASDWRVQLQPDSRQRIVNKIMDTLNKHLPVSGPEGLLEIWRIAQRFEEKIFTAATNQSDYLRKISLKMLTMDTTSRGHHGQPSNQFGPDNKPAGPDLRKQSNRSKRRPTWTDDYIMG